MCADTLDSNVVDDIDDRDWRKLACTDLKTSYSKAFARVVALLSPAMMLPFAWKRLLTTPWKEMHRCPP